jgi:hypothetical protein
MNFRVAHDEARIPPGHQRHGYKAPGNAHGDDIELTRTAEKAWHQMVDRFYQKNEDMMSPQQYEMAKGDFEYFMRLVDLAMALCRDGVEEGKGGNGG